MTESSTSSQAGESGKVMLCSVMEWNGMGWDGIVIVIIMCVMGDSFFLTVHAFIDLFIYLHIRISSCVFRIVSF